MAEASLKLGGSWGVKEGSLLGFNDENGNYKPIPFDFTRATTATRVNRDGLIEEVQSGVPRIDFSGGDGSLLLEPQRTNSLLQSNQFDTTWVLGSSTLTSGQTGYDGSLNAWLLTKTAASGNIYQGKSYSGLNTFSIYAKGNTTDWIRLRNTAGYVYFDVTNGVVGGNINAISPSITSVGSGWYRCEVAWSGTGTITQVFVADSDGSTSGTSGSVYIQYAQLEAGSYATSYIKTSGSAVTRNADVCNDAGDSNTFNDSEGVLYAEIAALDDDSSSKVMSISDGSTSNAIQLFYYEDSIRLNLRAGGVSQAYFNQSITYDDFIKVAVKYKANDVAFWVNGVETHTDTTATMPTGLDEFSFDNGAGSADFFGNCKEIRVYNTALTDTELQELTTL